MKPAPFDYVRPASVAEALAALGESDEAKVLAGGQSLVPLMNFRLAAPELLVDINRIAGLDYIRQTDGGIAIGATARQASVQAATLVHEQCPLLAEALGHIGHPQLRTRGTVVGSLAHHDPAAELPAVAVALGATVTVAGQSGSRRVAAADFFHGTFTTDVAEDEIATEVWFPNAPEATGSAFAELARRPGDFAMVGVAATIQLRDEVIASATVVLSGMADRPVRCTQTEDRLTGAPATESTFTAAAAAADREPQLRPPDDVHATSGYRRRVLGPLIVEALSTAADRAGRSSRR